MSAVATLCAPYAPFCYGQVRGEGPVRPATSSGRVFVVDSHGFSYQMRT